MGEYASRGSTHAGPVSTSAGYSAPQPAQTPVDRARDLASSAKRQLTFVESALTELTAAHAANNLPRWKHARARLDVVLTQAGRRLDQLRSRASKEAETIAALEAATRDLATETELAHAAEPPKGYVVVEHEDALLASLQADATLDSVRTLLDELAIADLRVLRSRIASPQPQDALATEIWQLGEKRRQEVSDFIHNVDRRKARERVARPHVEIVAPTVETLDTKLSAAFEGSDVETEVFSVIAGLDGAERRSLADRLRNYRPGSGDSVGARFVRLESELRTRIFGELAKPVARVAVVQPAPQLITTYKSASTSVSDRAHDFVRSNRRPLVNAIADRILELGVPRPHPRLHWVSFEGGARAIANEIRNYVEAAPDAALARIARLITTSDLEANVTKVLDQHGDLSRVALLVAMSFDAPVAESVERMGTRLRAQMDAHHKLPEPSTLVASNQLDRVVADAMRGRVDGEALARGAKPEQRGRSLIDGAREVEYEWLGKTEGEQLWNWIRVKSPHDATAEDVATTPLAGGNSTGTEQAYRIAANPPYFGIPFETARLISDAFDYAPAAVKAELAHGPGPRVADPDMLARTVVGDGVAIAHAPKATHGDLAPEHSLTRLELELDTLQNALAPWHVTRPLEAARAFVARRRADAPAHASQWATVLSAQERTVHAVATEIGPLTAKPPTGTASDRPISNVLMAYARAVEVSALATQAVPTLAEARHQLAMLPLAQLDLQLEENRKANPQQDPAQALELAKHAADLRANIERGDVRDPKAVETFAVESGEIALRGQLGSFAAGLKDLDNAADEAGIPTSAYSGGLPTLHAMSAVLLKRIGAWTAELDNAGHFTGPKPGESAEQTLLEQRRAAITTISMAVAATQKELQVDKYIEWAQQTISDAMLVKRIVSLVVRLAAEIALMILTGQLAEAGVAAVRGVMLGAEMVGEVREASFAFKIAKSIVAGGLNTVGGAALGGDVSMKAFIENAVAMGTMTTIMEPFEGLIGESAAVENELRTLGQRAVRTGTELAIEASAGYAGSFVGHAAVNGATIATSASGEVLEQAFTLLVGKFVHQRTLKMSERVNVAATRLGQDAVAGLRARVAQLAERTGKSRGERREALAELGERHQLLLEERALYKGHPELEKLAHDEPALGGKFADAPLVLSHLEQVVAGHAYLGTREQIDNAVVAMENTGLEPKRLPDQTAGTRLYQVGDRVIELRETSTTSQAKKSALSAYEQLFGRPLSARENQIVDRLMSLSEADGRRLILEFQDELLTYLDTNPITNLKELETDLSRERRQIRERVKGLYKGVDGPPKDWKFLSPSGVEVESDGTKVIATDVYGPNGAKGYFARAYNPKTKVLELRMAFLREAGEEISVPNMVPKQGDSPEMIVGKGTPTVQFVTMYQMRELGVPLGTSSDGVHSVHLSDIQNVETIVHLHYLRSTLGGEPAELIQHTASMKYAETTVVQTGYQRSSTPHISGGGEQSIGPLLQFQEAGSASRKMENDAILAKYGFSRDTVMLWGFDIDFDVSNKQ